VEFGAAKASFVDKKIRKMVAEVAAARCDGHGGTVEVQLRVEARGGIGPRRSRRGRRWCDAAMRKWCDAVTKRQWCDAAEKMNGGTIPS
jgi:hypothetical protein